VIALHDLEMRAHFREIAHEHIESDIVGFLDGRYTSCFTPIRSASSR